MNKEYKTEQLTGNELLDYTYRTGLTQEINRTLLHPLGLEIRINELNEIELWKTTDPKGFLIDRINPMFKQMFQKLIQRKHTERTRKLGFGIQTHDLYRTKNINEIGDDRLIPPERFKIDILTNSLTIFGHDMYTFLIQNLHDKGDGIDPDQYKQNELLADLRVAINKKDWAGIAIAAMFLSQQKEIKKEFIKRQDDVKQYEGYKEQLARKKSGEDDK